MLKQIVKLKKMAYEKPNLELRDHVNKALMQKAKSCNIFRSNF